LFIADNDTPIHVLFFIAEHETHVPSLLFIAGNGSAAGSRAPAVEDVRGELAGPRAAHVRAVDLAHRGVVLRDRHATRSGPPRRARAHSLAQRARGRTRENHAAPCFTYAR